MTRSGHRRNRGRERLAALRLVALAASSIVSPAGAQCPPVEAPAFYAYQSDAATVELVVAGGTLAGARHWEAWRTESGERPVRLLPARIAPGTPSIVDRGQGLRPGGAYTYSLTVEEVGGRRSSYGATVIDVANRPPIDLGSGLTLSSAFGFHPRSGERLRWKTFPAPIGPVHAKYFGSARAPLTNAALACATVTVRHAGKTTPAHLYADRYGKLRLPNPMGADRGGRFEFYAENGRYDIAVSAGADGYTLADVTVHDPRAAQVAHAAGDDAALTLTTGEAPGVPPDGNIHMKLTRPNSTDGNNPPLPYRLLAHRRFGAWALTHNLGVDERTGSVLLDDPVRSAFFLRVSHAAEALEFGVDPGYGQVDGDRWQPREPALETLLQAGARRTHFKSLLAPVAAEAIAAEAGIEPGQIVVYGDDGKVRRATTSRALHPFAVVAVDTASGSSEPGSRVYLAIAGQSHVRVRGTFALNDPLVAGADGFAYAARGKPDARYVVGYAQRYGGKPGAITWVPVNAR